MPAPRLSTSSSSPAAQTQKKQQTISSFFGAKPAASSAAPAKSPLIPTRSNANIAPRPTETASDAEDSQDGKQKRRRQASGSMKRSLEGCAYEEQPAKKAKVDTRQLSRTRQGHAGNGSRSPIARQSSSPPRSPPLQEPIQNPADRTTRYLFSSSAVQAEQDDDAEYTKQKQRLHQRFVKKLGHPDSISQIKRRNHFIEDATGADMSEAAADDEDGQAEADEDQDARSKKSSSASKAKSKSTKLTPMEKQIIEIKRQHMDAVIVVEVGYKFRFFGEDARIAAKELSIVCIPGRLRFDEHPSEAHMDRFASASIPTHRLHVHVRRLVAAGHKVGVVRQLETAALKAAGDNRNAPFVRKLTNMYTKGTYIEDVDGLDAPTASPSGGAPATGHLLCITERNAGGSGSDELVHVGILAVQPGTGDIVYDEFDDGFMRSEVETRLLHIAPCEFLIVGELSKATDKLIQHLSGSKTNVFKDKARVERTEKTKRAAAESAEHIGQFYRTLVQSSEEAKSDGVTAVLDTVRGLPEQVTICLSAMIKHLTEYGLEHVFDLTNNFQAFSARSHMLLNGNTLSSLEIYRNQTDNTEKGSLFWVMDRTQTRFGQRLLRKWVGRPLLDQARLQERVDAVEELKDGDRTGAVEKLRNLLSKTRSDLEKSLIRIYYRKCTRPELVAVLQTMQRIATEYAHVKGPADAGFNSQLVNEAIAQLPLVLDDLLGYLERINPQAAKDNDKFEFFREEHQTDDIASHKLGISLVEEEFEKHRKEAAQKLRKTKVDYVTVAGIDYLIEVENTAIKNVPASWAKISGTKKVSRFHTPEVIRMIRERDQHKESLAAACDAAFDALLADISTRYQEFRNVIQSLATLDCLLSLADVASRPDYCKPTFCSDTRIEVKGGRHPMVEQLLLDAYVPNDISLANADNETRALIVTGPNMGGKSSYVRQVALTCIMGQIGSYVPAASASLGMLDAVFTRMGAFDNMLAGESTFMVELSETADILKQATPRSLVILDELGRGTSTHDGVAIAHAVLEHMVRSTRCLLLFITHYQNLSTVAAGFERGELRNVHMRFTEADAGGNGGGDDDDNDDEADGGGSHVTFLYELGDGVAHRSYGLNVARLAGLPRAVRDVAHRQSQALEQATRAASLRSLGRRLARLVSVSGEGENGDDHSLSAEQQKQQQDELAELVGGISML